MDLSKYVIPLEKGWQQSKLETFRIWILYALKEGKNKTKGEIITSLKNIFQPEYVPIVSEFRFSLGKGFDFNQSLDMLLEPLIKWNLIVQINNEYLITEEGRNYIKRKIQNSRLQKVYS